MRRMLERARPTAETSAEVIRWPGRLPLRQSDWCCNPMLAEMTFNQPDEVDAALLLDGLADTLELLPPHKEQGRERFLAQERSNVIRVCRSAARQVHPKGGQSFDDAKAYAGDEFRNALLRSLFGTDRSVELLDGIAE